MVKCCICWLMLSWVPWNNASEKKQKTLKMNKNQWKWAKQTKLYRIFFSWAHPWTCWPMHDPGHTSISTELQENVFFWRISPPCAPSSATGAACAGSCSPVCMKSVGYIIKFHFIMILCQFKASTHSPMVNLVARLLEELPLVVGGEEIAGVPPTLRYQRHHTVTVTSAVTSNVCNVAKKVTEISGF